MSSRARRPDPALEGAVREDDSAHPTELHQDGGREALICRPRSAWYAKLPAKSPPPRDQCGHEEERQDPKKAA